MAAREGLTERFERFSQKATHAVGRPWAFLIALLVIILWAVSGPLFGFGDTWQLVINTGTTIVTFLMVFLIQNTQNRDSEAIHVKPDELIRTIEGAHNALLDLDDLDENELVKIRSNYAKIALEARRDLARGKADTGVGKVKLKDALPRRGNGSGR